MYAIIATGGKQYKVSEGDIINVEKLGVEAGETVTFDQVLAVNNGEISRLETPTVANATVTASVVKEGKSKESYRLQVQEKIRISQEKRSQTGSSHRLRSKRSTANR